MSHDIFFLPRRKFSRVAPSSLHPSFHPSTFFLHLPFFPSNFLKRKDRVGRRPPFPHTPNQQRALNKLPTELRCRYFVYNHRLGIQLGAKGAKNVYAMCIYSNRTLRTTVAGWEHTQREDMYVLATPITLHAKRTPLSFSLFLSLSLSLSLFLFAKAPPLSRTFHAECEKWADLRCLRSDRDWTMGEEWGEWKRYSVAKKWGKLRVG